MGLIENRFCLYWYKVYAAEKEKTGIDIYVKNHLFKFVHLDKITLAFFIWLIVVYTEYFKWGLTYN